MNVALILFQRAGDYVLAWSDELDAQSTKMFGGTAATKTTLVKRSAKDRGEGVDSGAQPAKRPKIESDSAGLDADIKWSYEKGSVSKVSLGYHNNACIELG